MTHFKNLFKATLFAYTHNHHAWIFQFYKTSFTITLPILVRLITKDKPIGTYISSFSRYFSHFTQCVSLVWQRKLELQQDEIPRTFSLFIQSSDNIVYEHTLWAWILYTTNEFKAGPQKYFYYFQISFSLVSERLRYCNYVHRHNFTSAYYTQIPPWGRRGFKPRIRPPCPQRVVKGD